MLCSWRNEYNGYDLLPDLGPVESKGDQPFAKRPRQLGLLLHSKLVSCPDREAASSESSEFSNACNPGIKQHMKSDVSLCDPDFVINFVAFRTSR
jgi:hypothetical protein